MVLLLQDETNELFLMVTKRPLHIKMYAGDYCFPGGMKESADRDLKATVVREVQEELGVKAENYQIIGQLDDFLDRHGNLVTTVRRHHCKKYFLSLFKNGG